MVHSPDPHIGPSLTTWVGPREEGIFQSWPVLSIVVDNTGRDKIEWESGFVKTRIHDLLFFTQPRVWKWWKVFGAHKLRTMFKEDPEYQELLEKYWKDSPLVWKDPRVWPIAKIVRKLWIDELPQAKNIHDWDMVIVWGRPLKESEHADAPETYKQRSENHYPGVAWVWHMRRRKRKWWKFWKKWNLIEYEDNRVAAAKKKGIPVNLTYQRRFTKDEQNAWINVNRVKKHEVTMRMIDKMSRDNNGGGKMNKYFWDKALLAFKLSCILSDAIGVISFKHK